jgi:hypothetical protein
MQAAASSLDFALALGGVELRLQFLDFRSGRPSEAGQRPVMARSVDAAMCAIGDAHVESADSR